MRVRPLAIAALLCLSACIDRCATNVGDAIGTAIGKGLTCGLDELGESLGDAIGSAIEGAGGRPVNGAVVSDVDGGVPEINAYQNLPGGYVHLTYYGGLASGTLPSQAPAGDCLQNQAYYHDLAGGASYPVKATAIVYSDGTIPGATLDVELTDVSYGPGDASIASLPDLRMTFTVSDSLPPSAEGGAEE
jgi:hypothetical protein